MLDNSGKHKIVSRPSYDGLDFGSVIQEVSNAKKKVIAEQNLKDWTKFTTQINDKKQIPVFLTRHLCASLNNSLDHSCRFLPDSRCPCLHICRLGRFTSAYVHLDRFTSAYVHLDKDTENLARAARNGQNGRFTSAYVHLAVLTGGSVPITV